MKEFALTSQPEVPFTYRCGWGAHVASDHSGLWATRVQHRRGL